jgi:hypothetical protein
MKQRAKHEERIERVMGPTIGTYGNINGIAGKTLQKIEIELGSIARRERR